MKSLSFNQLQLQIFALIFALFTSTVIGYRIFIERPQLEASIAQLAQRELTTLSYAANKMHKSLEKINYDYAVWDATYDFVNTQSSKYIKENFPDDTFVSLKVDGVVIFNAQLQPIYVKGYHHEQHKPLKLTFHDFTIFPENKKLAPLRQANQTVATQTGVISTQHGPALFAATDIKRSDRTGEFKGFLVFIQLIDESKVNELAEYTLTLITISEITPQNKNLDIEPWTTPGEKRDVTPYSRKFIMDLHGKPVSLLTIEHSESEVPPLMDKQSFIFILLFTLLIFVVYTFISYIIVRPVKKLASDIKLMDESKNFVALEEDSPIRELAKVSKHFNALMYTVQRQNELLSQQVYVDALTNIANRRGFEQHLEKQCQLFIRQRISFTVIIADVDHFKLYNDTLGHIAGDNALVKVASTLNTHFQRTNDICARYGGEEFIMLYSDIQPDVLNAKLDKILAAFAALNLAHPSSPTAPYMTVSLGACTVSSEDNLGVKLSPKAVIRAADHALYQAKNGGRNRAVAISFSSFKIN